MAAPPRQWGVWRTRAEIPRQLSVIWSDEAIRDIEHVVAYLAPLNPLAARTLARDLFIAGDSLATFPHRGRPGRADGTREQVAVWTYIIVYQTDGTTVTILRLWHGAQDR